MGFEWDRAKEDENVARHGLSFSRFAGFDSQPTVVIDDRHAYGERRFRAIGRIEGLGHCLVYTIRGSAMRLISFRRAHDKEMQRYE